MQMRQLSLYENNLEAEILKRKAEVSGKKKLYQGIGDSWRPAACGSPGIVCLSDSSRKDRLSEEKEDHLEVSIIFKIGAVGILVSVLSQILKHSGREEQAFLVSFSGLLLVLFWIVPYIYELFKNIQQLFVL